MTEHGFKWFGGSDDLCSTAQLSQGCSHSLLVKTRPLAKCWSGLGLWTMSKHAGDPCVGAGYSGVWSARKGHDIGSFSSSRRIDQVLPLCDDHRAKLTRELLTQSKRFNRSTIWRRQRKLRIRTANVVIKGNRLNKERPSMSFMMGRRLRHWEPVLERRTIQSWLHLCV